MPDLIFIVSFYNFSCFSRPPYFVGIALIPVTCEVSVFPGFWVVNAWLGLLSLIIALSAPVVDLLLGCGS